MASPQLSAAFISRRDSAGLSGEPALLWRSPDQSDPKVDDAEGSRVKATVGAIRWLEAEWLEVQVHEAKRPVESQTTLGRSQRNHSRAEAGSLRGSEGRRGRYMPPREQPLLPRRVIRPWWPGRWMRDDQTHGTTTRESSAGSTSGNSFAACGSSAVAVGETVCVDRPHVDDSDSRSGRRQMVPTV